MGVTVDHAASSILAVNVRRLLQCAESERAFRCETCDPGKRGILGQIRRRAHAEHSAYGNQKRKGMRFQGSDRYD